MAIASSAAVSGEIGILGKHKRQRSRGRDTLRCHCQPHQQAAIESVPLRNLVGMEAGGIWKPPPPHHYSAIRGLTESTRTCQVWKREIKSENKMRRRVQVEAKRWENKDWGEKEEWSRQRFFFFFGGGESMLRTSIFQTSPDMKVGRHRADRIQRKLPVAF